MKTDYQTIDRARDLSFALWRVLDQDRLTYEEVKQAKALRQELLAVVAGDLLAARLAERVLERSEWLSDFD